MIDDVSKNSFNQNNALVIGQKSLHSLDNSGSKESISKDSSLDSINISEDAIKQYELSKNIEEAESFISKNKSLIYGKTINSLNSFPENLASQLNRDSPLSTEERSEIQNNLNQREHEAFGKYAKQSPPDFEAYYEHYIGYLDSLSPEEGQSERYLGQREAVLPLYENAARSQGSEPRDFSFSQDPILSLFEALEARDFYIENTTEFKQEYLDKLSALFNDDEKGESFTQEAEHALNNFERTYDSISAALNGDKEALTAIKQLVNGELTVSEFIKNQSMPPSSIEGSDA